MSEPSDLLTGAEGWQRYQKPQRGHRVQILRRLPFRVHVVQTDTGAEFQSHFHWHIEDLDIRHVYVRSRTPHLNGKVERSQLTDLNEFWSHHTPTEDAIDRRIEECELSPLRNQTVFGVKAPGTFRRLGATSLSAYRRR